MAKLNKKQVAETKPEEATTPLTSGDTANESWDKPEAKQEEPLLVWVNEGEAAEYLNTLKSSEAENTPPEPSDLQQPAFHDQESDAVADIQSKPRYHRQDVVNIAQVVHEALKVYDANNGGYSSPHWDEASPEERDAMIVAVDHVLDNNTEALTANKRDFLIVAIVNALK